MQQAGAGSNCVPTRPPTPRAAAGAGGSSTGAAGVACSATDVCDIGLVCQFDIAACATVCVAPTSLVGSSGGGGTVHRWPPEIPSTTAQRSCSMDTDCSGLGSGQAACMYGGRQAGSFSAGANLCSLGRLGDRCQCSGYGCDITSPPSYRPNSGNNNGTKRIACQAPYECVPFVVPTGSVGEPRDLDYYCQRPQQNHCSFKCNAASDPVQLVGSCANPGVRAGTTECHATCLSTCGATAACVELTCVASP